MGNTQKTHCKIGQSEPCTALDLSNTNSHIVFNDTKLKVYVRDRRHQMSSRQYLGTWHAAAWCHRRRTSHIAWKSIRIVKCHKPVAKNGRVYNTSALSVTTCDSKFESLFHDEALWPIGSDSRNWVFHNKDGGQSGCYCLRIFCEDLRSAAVMAYKSNGTHMSMSWVTRVVTH